MQAETVEVGAMNVTCVTAFPAAPDHAIAGGTPLQQVTVETLLSRRALLVFCVRSNLPLCSSAGPPTAMHILHRAYVTALYCALRPFMCRSLSFCFCAAQCYHQQVRHGLAPAPANILQVLLLWLPNGFRVRTQCFKTLWLPFGLDGYTPAAAAAAPELLIATGPAEVGWLAFHCTVFPIASVLALLSLVAHVPFGVLWYARQGHRMWLSDTWGAAALEPDPNSRAGSGRPSTSDPMPQGAATKQPSSMDTSQQLRHSASRNAAAVSLRLSGRLGGGQGSWQRARRAAVLGLVAAGSPDTAAKLAMSAPSSSRAAAGGSPRVTFAQSGPAATGLLVPVHKQPACGGLHWFWAAFASRVQTVSWLMLDGLRSVITLVLAAVIGLIAHTVLIVGLALVLCWTFVTRLVFALWCIFIPAAANHSVCLQPTRHCNYWSRASIQASFAGFTGVSDPLPPQQQQPPQPQPQHPLQQRQQHPLRQQQHQHQPVMPQPGSAQNVWDSLGNSGRLSEWAARPPGEVCISSAGHCSERVHVQAAAGSAGSRAPASLQAPSPQVTRDTRGLSSPRKARIAEETQGHSNFIHNHQQQHRRIDMAEEGNVANGSWQASSADAADYTFEATVQYIAAMTGLQPARAVPEVAPPLVAPVQQQQVISDSSSSLAPQQSIDGADDHLVL